MTTDTSTPQKTGAIGWYSAAIARANSLPMSPVQLLSRLAVAHVFWASSQAKLASWPMTIQLFTLEYHLPMIDPDVAALLATAAELGGSILIFLGLFSRLAALLLLVVVATIQIFVYPENWAEHLTWAALLLLIFSRGAGIFSLDHLATRLFLKGR